MARQPLMRFRNFGGIHQLVIADAADLARIHDLDAARWAATSAPLSDLRCDPALPKPRPKRLAFYPLLAG
jgi:hypothetical protein